MKAKLKKQLEGYEIIAITHLPGTFISEKIIAISLKKKEQKPIKEDASEWIMVTVKDYHEDIKYMKPYKANKVSHNGITVIDEVNENHFIFDSEYRVCTKAEIEAHKLGFHIGDEVRHINNHTFNIIESFDMHGNKIRVQAIDSGIYPDIRKLTKWKPVLTLAGQEIDLNKVTTGELKAITEALKQIK